MLAVKFIHPILLRFKNQDEEKEEEEEEEKKEEAEFAASPRLTVLHICYVRMLCMSDRDGRLQMCCLRDRVVTLNAAAAAGDDDDT